jgi:hypothetical protein
VVLVFSLRGLAQDLKIGMGQYRQGKWRCQPVHERTSYSSSLTSPLPASKHTAMVQRVPGIRSIWARIISAGARIKIESEFFRLLQLAADQTAQS